MKGFLLRRLLSIIQLNIRRNLASSRTGGRKLTHYDVLKISNDSTKNEIRSAFIKLSKELHPDKNKELQNTHQEFVKLNEAYSVLIKPEARRQYDLTLRQNQILPPICHERPSPVRDPWKDPSLFHNRDKSKDKENGRNSYYGIKNFKRVSNNWVALMILTVAAVGAVLQAFLIRCLRLMMLDTCE